MKKETFLLLTSEEDDLSLVAVIICLTSRCIFHEHESACTIILLARFAIGVGNTVEEVFWIKYLMESLEVVGVRDVTLGRYRFPKFCRKIRQEVTYIVYFLIITNLIFY